MSEDAIRCDACPVMCYIKPGRTGACDRYGNQAGKLVRLDAHVILERSVSHGAQTVSFLGNAADWDGSLVRGPEHFVTAIGAGTTYPDYKPAPFIVSSAVEGVDMVTVVTEGIFSYCGVKVKIDTDRYVGAERSLVRRGRGRRTCNHQRIWIADALSRRRPSSDRRKPQAGNRHLRNSAESLQWQGSGPHRRGRRQHADRRRKGADHQRQA